MSNQRAYKVFLSYSDEDQGWAREFASALDEEGVSAWFDASQIVPGEPWKERIQDALRQSRVLVLILSPRTLRNPWTSFELGAAVADNKRIIPVVMEDVPQGELPPLVFRYKILRESSPRTAAKRVAEALTKLDAA